MFKNRSPGEFIQSGLLISMVSFVADFFVSLYGLSKGETDAHFGQTLFGHTIDVLSVLLGILVAVGLILIVAGIVRLVINRFKTR